jgi:DNA-binding HxlR family transcriptional regulator
MTANAGAAGGRTALTDETEDNPGQETRNGNRPLAATLAQVGDRWSLLVVDALLDGPRRFGELQRAIPAIATNVLAQRLRHLESARVVLAEQYSRRPERYRYQLTATGAELAGALRLLTRWGAAAIEETGPLHSACGTPLEVHWWCPTCDQRADDAGGHPPEFV